MSLTQCVNSFKANVRNWPKGAVREKFDYRKLGQQLVVSCSNRAAGGTDLRNRLLGRDQVIVQINNAGFLAVRDVLKHCLLLCNVPDRSSHSTADEKEDHVDSYTIGNVSGTANNFPIPC